MVPASQLADSVMTRSRPQGRLTLTTRNKGAEEGRDERPLTLGEESHGGSDGEGTSEHIDIASLVVGLVAGVLWVGGGVNDRWRF
jgi:hypothetical protein